MRMTRWRRSSRLCRRRSSSRAGSLPGRCRYRRLPSADGKELIAGGYHELTVWNPENGQLIRRMGNVGERTYGLGFKPAGSQLAVACGRDSLEKCAYSKLIQASY